ncbi:MAG: hypothetical protein LBE56_12870 [Tannerella sp.]|nr:hypothetical protein [Tannerella sp.]
MQSIGRNADFSYSQITDLGNLQRIGRNANFSYSQITDLGNLQRIGGSADINDSTPKNIQSQLKHISFMVRNMDLLITDKPD